MSRVNLLDLNLEGLNRFFAELGEKPFRARQVMHWMHQTGASDFSAMTDLAKSLREKLANGAEIRAPGLIREQLADDGTRKWLLDVGTGNGIETVFIPETGRGTLCVSTQVGCALECRFCSTGRQGFNRNLSVAEIVGQLWWANRALGDGVSREQCLAKQGATGCESPPGPRQRAGGMPRTVQGGDGRGEDRVISNVVLMGMGEPLANFDNVVTALNIMLDDHAYGLSRRRVTVSTSGLVPAMDRLRKACPVALAVSLHAPNDALRDQLMPINRKYPLHALMAACRRYVEDAPRDFITFEYVLLDGINDGREHARQLIELVRDVPCKFNLIPFNPFTDSGFRAPSADAVRSFQHRLMAAGHVATVRKTRGDDIEAACGQLVGQVVDRSKRTSKRLSAAA